MNKSYLIASALALSITVWMMAGYRGTETKNEPVTGFKPPAETSDLMLVEVQTETAQQVAQHIVAQGQVEPNRTVTVRAETAGQIAEVVAEKGRAVQAEDVLVRIKMNERQVRLAKAEALVRERQPAHEGADRLGEKGFQSQRLIDETYSELQSAQAALEEIRLEIDNTTVRAPFDGILETRRVELGDYMAVNGEIAVPNPDSRIPSGTSAVAHLPIGTVLAHFISPGLLSLNDAGVLGVKTVDAADTVDFHPVTIVRAESGGI